MTALEPRNTNDVRVTGQIPLRFVHSISGNFTLPIQHKRIVTELLPFSLKKQTVKLNDFTRTHNACDTLQRR